MFVGGGCVKCLEKCVTCKDYENHGISIFQKQEIKEDGTVVNIWKCNKCGYIDQWIYKPEIKSGILHHRHKGFDYLHPVKRKHDKVN